MKSYRGFSTLVGFALLTAGLCWSTAASAQNSCQPLYDALTKLSKTPSHSYARVENPGGEPLLTEYIYLQGKAYMKVGDTWTENPLSAKDLLDKEIQNRKNHHSTCKFVRADSAIGQPANLYSLHSETPFAKEDLQIRIFKKTGLPASEEGDIDLVGGPGKRHIYHGYEYQDVRAPI